MIKESQLDCIQDESLQRIRVMITDNQPSFRKRLGQLLEFQPDILIVGEARNGHEAYHLIHKLDPEVLLMVVRMPLLEGIETSRVISERYKQIQIIYIFMMDEEEFFPDSQRFGVIGYPLTDPATHQIVSAIRSMVQGEYLDEPVPQAGTGAEFKKNSNPEQRQAVFNLHLNNPLNTCEFNILNLICEGLSNHEIAAAQNLSIGTVRNYVTSIYKKLEVRNRTEAVFKARRFGML